MGLLDFAQAASNAAASNVSGPVDLLALALRKAGLPIPDDPVLGSEWMRRRGLTKPVQQKATNVLGETMGLLAPVAAAVKAPQVANGLLKMMDNAAAPATLNKQLGALVVAPHKPDKTRLAEVMQEMERLGAPTIRAYWDDAQGAYRALEGSHRLAAAKKLGIEPKLVEMNARQWMGPHDFPDIKDKASVDRILDYLKDSRAYIDFPELPNRFGR